MRKRKTKRNSNKKKAKKKQNQTKQIGERSKPSDGQLSLADSFLSFFFFFFFFFCGFFPQCKGEPHCPKVPHHQVSLSLILLIGAPGVMNKVLYGEAPPRGLPSYPVIYHFNRKGAPFTFVVQNFASFFNCCKCMLSFTYDKIAKTS